MERVWGVIVRTSVPIINGDLRIALYIALAMTDSKLKQVVHGFGLDTYHMEKWRMYSSSLIPPLPTSSMSKSFHAPGWALLGNAATLLRMLVTEQWNPGRAQS